MATAAAAVPRTTAPRLLYVGLALLAVVIAAVGFWPTYFGPLVAGAADKTPIIHLHAAVYVGWLALFVTQTPELHKRLMIVATTSLLIAAVGRMQLLGEPRVVLVQLIWSAPILLAMAHDFWRQRRIHPVYVVGLVVLLLEGPLVRGPARTSEQWLNMSSWLAAWAA